ncbi:MAG: glycosyltransferase [Lachnospiraceae bacterium]|nr:glycosyltransferase [Lachnospiraceae bacterium]
MKRNVLMCIPDLGICNGVTSFMLSFYDYLIEQEYSVDFLVVEDQHMEKESYVTEKGSRVFRVPIAAKYDKSRIEFIDKVFRENAYDIVHVNFPGPNGAMVLKAAKKWGVKHRIYHCHNPLNLLSLKSTLSERVFTPICRSRANKFLACSKSAGISIFGNRDFQVINNAIEPRDFVFDAKARERVRKSLQLESQMVVGVAARMEAQKNPSFIVEVFAEMKKKCKDAVLVWVGDGGMQKQIEEACVAKNIRDAVFLVGRQPDVTEWYSAMDLFLLPSRYEGLGIVFLEAQANGLPTFGSDCVPEETQITHLMHRISLEKSAAQWADEIWNIYDRQQGERMVDIDLFRKHGFDVNYSKDKLYVVYESLYQE